MSSQPGAPDAPPPDGGGEDSRLHISAITEMPAGHDAELATIFREMRRASGISAQQMAGRLATPIETIEALENGALLALPEWPELTRIITAYATMLGLDSRPILRRLEGQLGETRSAAVAAAPAAPNPSASVSPKPSGPPMPPSSGPPPPRRPGPRRRLRRDKARCRRFPAQRRRRRRSRNLDNSRGLRLSLNRKLSHMRVKLFPRRRKNPKAAWRGS